VPTSPAAIYLADIVKHIETIGAENMHEQGVANCNEIKFQNLNLN
jgi:hypothetical protein